MYNCSSMKGTVRMASESIGCRTIARFAFSVSSSEMISVSSGISEVMVVSGKAVDSSAVSFQSGAGAQVAICSASLRFLNASILSVSF